MATIGYASLPVPAGADAPVGPGALADLAAALDSHLVQHVTNQAARDTTYADAPLHTVVTADNGSVWVKTSATSNVWATLWEPLPAWAPLQLKSGYESPDGIQYRIIGKQVFIRGPIQRTDGGLIVGDAGPQLATVPEIAIPSRIARFAGSASITGDAMTGVGRVEVLAHDTAQAAGPGAVLFYSQDGAQLGSVGVTWVDISGSYWID